MRRKSGETGAETELLCSHCGETFDGRDAYVDHLSDAGVFDRVRQNLTVALDEIPEEGQ